MADLLPGVELRGQSIRIWFMYKGKRSRELLKGWLPTLANIKKAGQLRMVIVSEISLGEFNYRSRFPDSTKADETTGTVQLRFFGELADTWLANRKIELCANTLRKTASQLRTIVVVVGADTLIREITHNDILRYRTELLEGETMYALHLRSNKIGRSVRTVDNYISLLCSILRFAHRSGFTTEKAYTGIKKLQKSNPKPDPLSRAEFDLLMKANHGQKRNLWQFAIYSGLRHGELAALAWEDIDLAGGTVSVKRNLNTLGMFGPPKTDAGFRTVTLLQPAISALIAQRELTGRFPKTEITFHHHEYGLTEKQRVHFVFMPRVRNGVQKAHYSLGSIAARWDSAVKRAGIRRRNPYHTRHTFACWLLSAGANPSFIANQMGHENAQMVYEIYATWIEEMNSEQVAMLNTKLAL
ncbi:Arm DNA-binding domain-containing protein [Citrobacter freundii]